MDTIENNGSLYLFLSPYSVYRPIISRSLSRSRSRSLAVCMNHKGFLRYGLEVISLQSLVSNSRILQTGANLKRVPNFAENSMKAKKI